MNSLISVSRRVRAINAELASGSTYAILRTANGERDTRITRASGARRELRVLALSTGRWIYTTPTDRIEITDAAGRVYATYQGGAV